MIRQYDLLNLRMEQIPATLPEDNFFSRANIVDVTLDTFTTHRGSGSFPVTLALRVPSGSQSYVRSTSAEFDMWLEQDAGLQQGQRVGYIREPILMDDSGLDRPVCPVLGASVGIGVAFPGVNVGLSVGVTLPLGDVDIDSNVAPDLGHGNAHWRGGSGECNYWGIDDGDFMLVTFMVDWEVDGVHMVSLRVQLNYVSFDGAKYVHGTINYDFKIPIRADDSI